MKRFTPWAIALLGVALAGAGGGLELPAARAGGAVVGFAAGSAACDALGGKAASGCGCRPCWCPDDYRPKPCPRFCLPRACGRCDDYCPKPVPCFRLPPTCGRCDDYGPKPAPCVRWPYARPEFSKCPPPLPCGR
ncbi:MAG TPA: hypothetical protein VMY37_14825 [Thermoguttaceae bacterium]|nr:hypothetical protein [Thermoguttaceae bacterium]